MALIQCSECGREVSDKAAACPGCGAPIAAPAASPAPAAPVVQQVQIVRQPKSRGVYIILALFFGIFGINNFYAGQNVAGGLKLGLLMVAFALDAITGFYTAFSLIVVVLTALWSIIEAIGSTEDGAGNKME